ncbi:glycosyl transferase family 2 [Denitrovibrio acetiphilus DSM 12809]|uniref:Glycosyl transferase family 2 n=1 Tax=Denitrovibrio acetiphilus (strain DSM 12809 / NBRC 114555 / N2460) TaxID=522772 RepID=D4H817_DENA2|nr:TIGR04283 family arsenosugar biosynthesis glycosyltransferase [Denitrovibrio acetiphilus]ADD68166.1 glycosyl transferase family 2 [Denitrovibrio acetiphilus DSM 12809]
MKVSVIIPVYNEQARINDLIRDIRSKSDCEIVICDPNGETVKSINDNSVMCVSSSKGRGIQMNTGAGKATGDLLVFLHADTILPDGFETEVRDVLSGYDVGAFHLEIDNRKFIFRIIEKGVSIRNRITRIPYGDQALFCTREAFEAVGGFQNISLMEDVRFMQDMKRKKKRIYLSGTPVRTSARRWEQEGFLFTCMRNWSIITLYYLGVSPNFLKRFYK